MRPYNIYLRYTNGFSLENDLLECKMIHPVLGEFLYVKYFKEIKKVLNWKKKENPFVKFKIINNRALMLHNGTFVKYPKSGGRIVYNDLAKNDWLVDEVEAKEERTIII